MNVGEEENNNKDGGGKNVRIECKILWDNKIVSCHQLAIHDHVIIILIYTN